MMKFIKWKTLIITCIVCLLPVFLGVALWDSLPDNIAIHFNFHNEPDNFAPKGFAVFGLPILMVLLQIFCCVCSDISSYKHGERKKFERVAKWIIPCMAVVLHTVTLGYSLGLNIDIRKVACLIIGVIFIVVGNYLPKLDYVKNYNIDTKDARKINRFLGFGNVFMGILVLISTLLPPIASVIWLILLVPYVITTVVYAIKITSNK